MCLFCTFINVCTFRCSDPFETGETFTERDPNGVSRVIYNALRILNTHVTFALRAHGGIVSGTNERTNCIDACHISWASSDFFWTLIDIIAWKSYIIPFSTRLTLTKPGTNSISTVLKVSLRNKMTFQNRSIFISAIYQWSYLNFLSDNKIMIRSHWVQVLTILYS